MYLTFFFQTNPIRVILKIVWRPAYDVGVAWLVTNTEREQNQITSWIRSKKQGFGKKNDEGFWYKPRGDWFSFAKVRNVGFLCSCKQPRETSISQRRTSFIIYSNGLNVWQSAEVRKKCLLDLKHGYVCYKNAWIRYRRPLFTLRSHVRHVLLWIRALFFMYSGLLTKSTPLPHCNAWRGQDNF